MTRRLPSIGQKPRTFNGVTMMYHDEVPQGVQAMYRNGEPVHAMKIGEQAPEGITCDCVLLNRIDYEVLLKSHLEAKDRSMMRRSLASRNLFKTPTTDQALRVLRASRGN